MKARLLKVVSLTAFVSVLTSMFEVAGAGGFRG